MILCCHFCFNVHFIYILILNWDCFGEAICWPASVCDVSGDNSCGSRWVKAMSPSSMQLPTMSTWDMMGGGRQAASPFSMNSGQGIETWLPVFEQCSHEVLIYSGVVKLYFIHVLQYSILQDHNIQECQTRACQMVLLVQVIPTRVPPQTTVPHSHTCQKA